jgi:hypothetical protein
MWRVVALGPLPMPNQWGLGSLPGLGIDERWDSDGAPVGLGAPRATLAIAGVASVKAAGHPPAGGDYRRLRRYSGGHGASRSHDFAPNGLVSTAGEEGPAP